MKRFMVMAFAMGLFAVIADAQTANATVAGPVVAAQDAKVAQVTSVNKVQWRRYGPGYRYGWHGGWRPGYIGGVQITAGCRLPCSVLRPPPLRVPTPITDPAHSMVPACILTVGANGVRRWHRLSQC